MSVGVIVCVCCFRLFSSCTGAVSEGRVVVVKLRARDRLLKGVSDSLVTGLSS